MARINTNISSLIARQQLNRTNQELNTALQRLSTGLRINTGEDDPAGLIASEGLRSDISNINRAISNTQRADNIIATADSALGEVSQLLNTIKGLIVETANSGTLSEEQIAANQLQVDSALQAINRIALTTTFQGRQLLDGSLAFQTDILELSEIRDWRIEKADLGATGGMNVDVSVQSKATQGVITNSSFSETNARAVLAFNVRSTSVLGDISVTALSQTQPVTINYQHDSLLPLDSVQAVYDDSNQTIIVSANASSATSITKSAVTAAIDQLTEFTALVNATTANDPAGDFTLLGSSPASDLLDETSIEFEADQAGADFNNISVALQIGTSTEAAFDAELKSMTITYVPGATTLADIATAINNLPDFSTVSNNNLTASLTAEDSSVAADTEFTGGGVLVDRLIVELSGATGTQTYNLQAGTTAQQLVDAVNLSSETTQVLAELDSLTGTITFKSVEYGSRAFVDLRIIEEGPNSLFSAGQASRHDTGVDIKATINGIAATGSGTQVSVNTSFLTMVLDLNQDLVLGPLQFTINGGGALFQIGSDIVSDQQARLGIESISTSTLGGPSGRLFEIGSSQLRSLTADIRGADRIISDVIGKISGLRGRLGAFQSTTLDSNSNSLSAAVSNLTEAESTIRDANFAEETAQLTRAQILSQSGLQVLGIANQNPENVLRLLQQ
jgi:flagellin